MKLSIVIPVFNEENNIAALFERLVPVMTDLSADFEIIFVDDGSTDGSFQRITDLCTRDRRVRVLSLSRNFGHQTALTAGMDSATGDAVIHMDADLQHPPELIKVLVSRWREGFEIVYTVRQSTQGVSWFKKLSERCYYTLFHWLSSVPLPAQAADFRLLDRKVVRAFSTIRERTRFLRGLTTWVGYRSVGVPYHAEARHSGKSQYTGWRMIRLAVDGMISFSAAPLLAAICVGIVFTGLAFIYMLYVIYVRLISHDAILGWASLIMTVLGIGGIQLVLLGLMGLYIGKIHEEVKQRPLYLVRETKGFDTPPA